jgi:hypothetical protein
MRLYLNVKWGFQSVITINIISGDASFYLQRWAKSYKSPKILGGHLSSIAPPFLSRFSVILHRRLHAQLHQMTPVATPSSPRLFLFQH